MKFAESGFLTLAGLLAAVSIATPALADFWWDTNEGQLYFDGASGNYGVFRFLDGNGGIKQDIAIYINGAGPQYTDSRPGLQPGTYDTQWFNYGGNDCSRQVVDPDGNVAWTWGTMWFTVGQDTDYFTAQVYDCDEQTPSHVLSGGPGTSGDTSTGDAGRGTYEAIEVGPLALMGVPIGTEAEAAAARLKAALGPGEDSGWVVGCEFNGVKERYVTWGGLTAAFEETAYIGNVFVNWSYGLDHETGSSRPGGPAKEDVLLPRGMHLGDRYSDAARVYGFDLMLDDVFGVGIFSGEYFQLMTSDDNLNGPIAEVAVPHFSFCE